MPYHSVEMINSTLSFDVLLPRGILMSKTLHRSRIRCMLLSVIEAYDLFSSYETGNSLLTDINCQRRAVCEVYKFQDQLGELSKRARHSLDYLDTLPYLSLPDEINEISDELVVIALLYFCM